MDSNATKTEIKYIIHSNKYGWCLRLGGWTGPSIAQCATKEEAYALALSGARGIDWSIAPATAAEIMVSI